MPRTEEQNQEIRNKTRKAILASSLKLFSLKGFHGTSISDIAKDAGISKGLAYNYFDSKQEIIEALFKQAFAEAEFLFAGFNSLNDPYEKIKYMINAAFEMTINNEEYWRLYTGLALQPGVVETAQRLTNEFTSGFLMLIEGLFKKLGVKNPHEEARMLGALFDGLGIQYLLDKENFPLEKMKKHFLQKYSKEGLEKLKS